MTATFLLIRHAAHGDLGQTLSGRAPGVTLSDRGRSQAAGLATHLHGHRLAAIHSSPVQRARDTADTLACGRGLTVCEAAALDEIDFGAWTGSSFAALEDDDDWRAWNSARGTACAPGGESMVGVQARVVAHIEVMAATWIDQVVALVTHLDVIRAALAHWLGLGLDRVLNFDVDPASVSRLIVGDWGGRVLSINEGAH